MHVHVQAIYFWRVNADGGTLNSCYSYSLYFPHLVHGQPNLPGSGDCSSVQVVGVQNIPIEPERPSEPMRSSSPSDSRRTPPMSSDSRRPISCESRLQPGVEAHARGLPFGQLPCAGAHRTPSYSPVSRRAAAPPPSACTSCSRSTRSSCGDNMVGWAVKLKACGGRRGC